MVHAISKCEMGSVFLMMPRVLIWAIKPKISEVSCDAYVHAVDEYALRMSSDRGHLEVVRYLVEKYDANIHAYNDYALRWMVIWKL